MSTVIATSVLPDSTANDTLTIGATGDSVAISGDSLNLNTLQDAGGNNIITSDGAGNLTVNSGFTGAMKFISSQTASSATSISFTSGLDSTYDVYVFKFMDIDAGTDDANLTFQVNAVGQTGYNETITSTAFSAYHKEDGSGEALGYQTGWDQAQGTAYQLIGFRLQVDADAVASGSMHLYGPSSTTYIKQFYSRVTSMSGAETTEVFIGGYINTTSAIDDIQFKVSSGTFDGTIAMYGMSKT